MRGLRLPAMFAGEATVGRALISGAAAESSASVSVGLTAAVAAAAAAAAAAVLFWLSVMSAMGLYPGQADPLLGKHSGGEACELLHDFQSISLLRSPSPPPSNALQMSMLLICTNIIIGGQCK